MPQETTQPPAQTAPESAAAAIKPPQFAITLPPGGGSYRLNADGTLTENT